MIIIMAAQISDHSVSHRGHITKIPEGVNTYRDGWLGVVGANSASQYGEVRNLNG